jgi:hypothetical protein
MEKVIAYKSFNGRLFENEEKCLSYERKMLKYPKVKETITLACRAYILGEYFPINIMRHTIETWEKPNGTKKVEKYFIVDGRYKFIDLHGKHESSVMNGGVFAFKGQHSMNWYLAFRYFAEQILLGKKLDDEFVKNEVEKINEINKIKLVVEIIEKNKKWKIDNPLWHSGEIAPYTFTMERIK